jgi:hypothetical protein
MRMVPLQNRARRDNLRTPQQPFVWCRNSRHLARSMSNVGHRAARAEWRRMTAAHRRGARGEQRVADMTGGQRVKRRPRHVSMPDIRPIPLKDGNVLRLEVKARARGQFPKWLTGAVAQAGQYGPGVPAACFIEPGSDPLVVLRLTDLVRLLDLGADDTQPWLFGDRS